MKKVHLCYRTFHYHWDFDRKDRMGVKYCKDLVKLICSFRELINNTNCNIGTQVKAVFYSMKESSVKAW